MLILSKNHHIIEVHNNNVKRKYKKTDSIINHNFLISSLDSPVACEITSIAIPSFLKLRAFSLFSSSLPSSLPFFSAVDITLYQSRKFFKLSQYSLSSVLVNFAISAVSKRRSKTLFCNALGRSSKEARLRRTKSHLSNILSNSSSVLLNLGISR